MVGSRLLRVVAAMALNMVCRAGLFLLAWPHRLQYST